MILESKKVWAIVPAYNEAAVIADTIRGLLQLGYSIVVVDDDSADNTAAIIKILPVYYIRHRINLGQGAALQTGMTFALNKGADYLITFDADGQHRPEDIPLMLEQLISKNLDMVFGSRFFLQSKIKISLTRRVILHFARYLNFLLTGVLLSDAHNGLRVFNRKTATLINIRENGMAHATELLMKVAKYKLKYAEVPVHINYTSYSVNKGQKSFHSFKVLQDILLYKIFK